jgi:hypothetical protein
MAWDQFTPQGMALAENLTDSGETIAQEEGNGHVLNAEISDTGRAASPHKLAHFFLISRAKLRSDFRTIAKKRSIYRTPTDPK